MCVCRVEYFGNGGREGNGKRGSDEPADLVALADLVHAPGEGPEDSEEDGDGAGALRGDAPGVADGGEAAGRGTVLEDGHLPHAHHPRLLPYHRLRHLRLRSTTTATATGVRESLAVTPKRGRGRSRGKLVINSIRRWGTPIKLDSPMLTQTSILYIIFFFFFVCLF